MTELLKVRTDSIRSRDRKPIEKREFSHSKIVVFIIAKAKVKSVYVDCLRVLKKGIMCDKLRVSRYSVLY